MATPNVLFRVEYNLPYSPGSPKTPETKRRDFVSCQNSGNNLYNYLTRQSAVDKENIETIKVIEQLSEHTEMSEQDLLNYASARPGSTGAFTADGDLTSEQAAEVRSELQKTQSIIWTGILSFKEDYGKKYCNNKAAAQEMLTATIKDLFAKSHLKYENIKWYAALHENTDNRHLHIVFWEKKPTFLRKGSTEYHYANKQKISPEACNNFKFSVAKHFEMEKTSSFQIRDNIRKDFRRNMNTGRRSDTLLDMIADVKNSNSWQFGKQNLETQEKILHFAIDIVNNDSFLKEKYDTYISELLKQQQKYLDICKENKLPASPAIKDFVNKNIKDLHQRLGNDVIFSLRNFDKEYAKIQRKEAAVDVRSENFSRLNEKDLALIEKICSKPIGANFKALFIGADADDTREVKFYRSEEAASLAFSSILIYFTQDKEQFFNILDAASIYTPDYNEEYDGQLSWAKNISEINTKQTYKEVLYDIAAWQREQKIKLDDYDNTKDKEALTTGDVAILKKIKDSKASEGFNKIAGSTWKNTQSDTTNQLQGYHLHCFHLIKMISRYTQDSCQIDRIFKATPLYKPPVWDGKYKNQFAWITDFSASGESYGEILKNFCIDRQLEWKEQHPLPAKQVLQGKQGNNKIAISRADMATRTISSLINNAFNMINTRFDNSFNQFQSAIKDQERRRKQIEGEGDKLTNE